MRVLVMSAVLCTVLVAAPRALAKPPSVSEQAALDRLKRYLDTTQENFDTLPVEAYLSFENQLTIKELLKKAESEFSRCPPGHPDLGPAKERLEALKATFEKKKAEAKSLAPGAKKVTEDVKTWVADLERSQADEPSAWQDANNRAPKQLLSRLSDLEAQLASAGNPEHPDAKAAAAAIADAKAKHAAALKAAKDAIAALGDWKAELTRLTDPFTGAGWLKPDSLDPRMNEKVDAWIDSLPAIEAPLVAAETYLAKVKAGIAGIGENADFRLLWDKVLKERSSFDAGVRYWQNELIERAQRAENEKWEVTQANVGREWADTLRRTLTAGLEAAWLSAKLSRVQLKNEAEAKAWEGRAATIEAMMQRFDEDEAKQLEAVRMPKERGTADMKKHLKEVLKSADFVKQMKSEGNTMLRAVVDDASVHTYKSTEWYQGRRYLLDYDAYDCLGAFKRDGKVMRWRFSVRFARSDWPGIKTGVWTYGGWKKWGPILEKNVMK